MTTMPVTTILGSCHGNWREQGLVCSLSDLLFNAMYIAQLFDWQNAVFLCFYPMMLFVAATIFRTTFKGFGAKDLDETIRNAGELPNGKPMPTSEGIELTNFEHYKVEAPRKNIAVMIAMAGFIWSIGLISWASTSQFVNPSAADAMYYQGYATQALEKGKIMRVKNIQWALFWLVFGSVLMSVAQILIKLYLSRHDINMVDMVANKGNIAVAIYEAGLQVSVGMIAGACISGPPSSNDGVEWDIYGVLIFFTLSIFLLVLWSFLFDVYIRQWHLWSELKSGNEAVAVDMCFQIICSACLLSNAISKSFELVTFFGWFVTGTSIRMLFRVVLDNMAIAPIHCFIKAKYTFAQLSIDSLIGKNNWGVAVTTGLLQLSVTSIINAFLPGFCEDYVYKDGRHVSMLTFSEKLLATEYVLLIWQWDRFVACLIIFFVFLLALPVYRLRLFMHSKRQSPERALDPDLNYYIYENKLNAVCISFGAFLMAVGNMMAGVFRDATYGTSFAKLEGSDAGQSWGLLLAQIMVGFAGVVLSLLINDRFVLHKFDNIDEMMRNNNVAVALVEAGSLIGSSFIIEANINGWDYSDPPYASTVILFFATQGLMVVFQLAYEAVTVFDDEQEVQLGNGAAGLFNGLNLVAVGLLLARCVYLSHSLVSLVCWSVVTFLLLFASEKLINRVVFPEFGFEAALRSLDTDSHFLTYFEHSSAPVTSKRSQDQPHVRQTDRQPLLRALQESAPTYIPDYFSDRYAVHQQQQQQQPNIPGRDIGNGAGVMFSSDEALPRTGSRRTHHDSGVRARADIRAVPVLTAAQLDQIENSEDTEQVSGEHVQLADRGFGESSRARDANANGVALTCRLGRPTIHVFFFSPRSSLSSFHGAVVWCSI